MAVIFPDIEQLIVQFLNSELASLSDPLAANVRVGTTKLPPEFDTPEKEVVVVANYSGSLDKVRATATATVEVYSLDYETASSLALLIGALIVGIPGESVKRAVVTLGPVRLSDESPLEKRSLSVDLVVKGSTL